MSLTDEIPNDILHLPMSLVRATVIAALGTEGEITLSTGSPAGVPIKVSDLNNTGFLRAYMELRADGHIQESPGVPGVNPQDEGEKDPKEQGGAPDLKELMAARILEMQGKGKTVGQRKVTTSQLRQALDELLGDSDKLREVLIAVLQSMKEDGSLDETLGVDEQMKELSDALIELITEHLNGTEERLQAEMRQKLREIEQKATTHVEFTIPDMPTIKVTDQHHMFPELLRNLHARIPTLLTGPTGSGKTTAAMKAAEVMGLDFSYMALGPTQPESKFSGYQDATGHYIPTEFYLRYRYGGVILLDELDAANANVLVWINGAVANKIATFPRGIMTDGEKAFWPKGAKNIPKEAGGMVSMHPDCVIIASANTVGKGADMMYHGRNALDASTLKRFAMILWEYDTNLEYKLSPIREWTAYVIAVRESVMDLRLPHPVSPVDSIRGGVMLLSGKEWNQTASETVFAGLRKEEIDRILNNPQHTTAITKAQSKVVGWVKARAEAKARDATVDAKPKAARS